MLGFVLILYFESLHMKTQLQFLSDTFLSTRKDYGGFLSLSKNVVTMFFLCGTVFFWWERCFSVKQARSAGVQLHGKHLKEVLSRLTESPHVRTSVTGQSDGLRQPCSGAGLPQSCVGLRLKGSLEG